MKGLGTCVIGAIALARKATAIAVAAADVPLPTSIEITNIRVFHCPFDVQASVASDLSSIDVTYDTTNGQSSLAAYGSSGQAQQTCYVKVEFDFSPNDEENTASVLQIDYEGAVRLDVDTEARIETQIAWDTMTGPVSS